jgi:hypothetical protein
MPIATGKKHRYIEMSDLGIRPVSPIDPSTTMIIGAIARIGMVCEAMIHGRRLFSSERTCTIAIARPMPSIVPKMKPTSVDDSVTQQ